MINQEPELTPNSRRISIIFCICSLIIGFILGQYLGLMQFNDSIQQGISTFGNTLWTCGTIFFFINIFVKKFSTRIIWFVLLIFPTFVVGYMFFGCSWPLFGDPTHVYHWTVPALSTVYLIEAMYLFLLRPKSEGV